jgi:hypothetical protein
MPLLNSGYLANWYKISLPYYDANGNITGNTYEVITENYTESKVQEAQNKALIQGDIGVHIMDVGTLYYTTSITSPVLINYTTEFHDIFDTIVYYTNIQRQPLDGTFGSAYLLKSARIEVTTDAVKATGNFEGDTAVASAYLNSSNQQVDLLARTARFYDSYFYFGEITASAQFPVISGEINLNFDIDKNFFLGQMWRYSGTNEVLPAQTPFFSLRSYSATGNIKIGLSPAQYVQLTALYAEQAPGKLVGNVGNIGVYIASYTGNTLTPKILNLGTAFVITKIEFSMQQSSIITATLEFNAFFNNAIGNLQSFDPEPYV